MVKESRSVDRTMETPMKQVAAGESEEDEDEEAPESESAPESAEASADEDAEESAESDVEERASVDRDVERTESEVAADDSVEEEEEEDDDDDDDDEEEGDGDEEEEEEEEQPAAQASADESTDTEEEPAATAARDVDEKRVSVDEKRVSVDEIMVTPLKETAAAQNGVKETPKSAEAARRPAGMLAIKKSHCNAPDFNQQGKHVANTITTSKYTILSAVPKNLYMQFSRLANVYFLIISVLQLLPAGLSPTNKYATAGPFSVILLLNFIRELYEDSKRHKADREVNNRKVDMVTAGGTLKSVRWKDVKVGDIVQVQGQSVMP
jgi:magnesium-transporting ATPase (P-type)